MIGKNHIFHRLCAVSGAGHTEGGGQKFVPAIENDARPLRSAAVFITPFFDATF